MGGYYLLSSDSLSRLTNEKVFSVRFTTRNSRRHINVKEMDAVLILLSRWTSVFAGKKVLLHCDNKAVVGGLKKSSIKGPSMAPLRQIAMLLAIHDIELEVVWIPTGENTVADCLSRGDYTRIADVCPLLQLQPQQPNPSTHGSGKSPFPITSPASSTTGCQKRPAETTP